jgi:hypothetical protein
MTIKELARHSTLLTTMRYMHLSKSVRLVPLRRLPGHNGHYVYRTVSL